MQVRKRNGTLQELDISQVRKQTIPACEGLNNVSYEELELNAKIMFFDGINSEDIQKALIKSARNLVSIEQSDYTYVAARLALYDLYHNIKRVYNIDKENFAKINRLVSSKPVSSEEQKILEKIEEVAFKMLQKNMIENEVMNILKEDIQLNQPYKMLKFDDDSNEEIVKEDEENYTYIYIIAGSCFIVLVFVLIKHNMKRKYLYKHC